MTHQLIVRNVEAAEVRALEAAAAEHGRTVGEEHREILRGAALSQSCPGRDA